MFEPQFPPMNAAIIYHTGRIEPNYPHEIEQRAQYIADRTGNPCQFMRDTSAGIVEVMQPSKEKQQPCQPQ